MKLEWVKSIPNFKHYFNEDHQTIIQLIGIDNFLKLLDRFGKTGIYFSMHTNNDDQLMLINQIGFDNYNKLQEFFGKTGIYFSTASLTKLKKSWAINNHQISYNEAARILEVSYRTIYNW